MELGDNPGEKVDLFVVFPLRIAVRSLEVASGCKKDGGVESEGADEERCEVGVVAPLEH